jgi:purine-binding chemotaxis protein CheW
MSIQRAESAPEKLVAFRIGEVAYAVPIHAVREIVNPVPLTTLPHLPAPIAGVVDHRGEVVVVVDLRTRFGLVSAPPSRRAKWILVSVEGRTVGLVVDQVTEVFATHELALRPPPKLGGGEDQRGIAGVTTHRGEMVFVLDVANFGALVLAVEEPEALPGTQESV